MKEFMMIFRHVPDPANQPSPEDLQEMVKHWQNWIGGIAAQDKFVATNSLGYEGKLLKPDGTVTDGPYAEIKEVVGGYIVVKAADIDEALSMANGCPNLQMGGTVEVRDIMVIPNAENYGE